MSPPSPQQLKLTRDCSDPLDMEILAPAFVHRSHSYRMDLPSPWGPLGKATAAAAYALAFALLCSVGCTGSAPSWLAATPIPTALRIVLVGLGAIHAAHGALLFADQVRRGLSLTRQKSGAFPTIESAGTCRILQEEGHWTLELALIGPTQWTELGQISESTGLLFTLEEADVARIARLFDPGEEVAIEWIDFPESAGGPTLVGIRTSAREERVRPGEVVSILGPSDPAPILGDDNWNSRKAA